METYQVCHRLLLELDQIIRVTMLKDYTLWTQGQPVWFAQSSMTSGSFSKFKGLTHEEKWRVVRSGGLCNKCLEKRHISKECLKKNFKCQKSGCRGNHHTFIHRQTPRIARAMSSGSSQRDIASQRQQWNQCYYRATSVFRIS